jgi:hypothetical protein
MEPFLTALFFSGGSIFGSYRYVLFGGFFVVSLLIFLFFVIIVSFEQIQSLIDGVQDLFDDLARAEVHRLRESFACWHSNNSTRIESEEFKNALVAYYQCASPITTSNDVMCMVTHTLFSRNEVIGSHIVKHATQGTTMHLYGLSPLDIDSPRNSFLALKTIEEAFDYKEVCFLYNPTTQSLHLKVLNPVLLNKKLRKDTSCTRLFSHVDNAVLRLPAGVVPFRRCLSMHAKLSFSMTLDFKRITTSAALDTYFNLSEAGLQEPLGLGDLTWQEVHGAIYSTKL